MWPFPEPNDACHVGLHDYHEIIRNPTYMGTVHLKLECDSPEFFAKDMRLIFTYCYRYNPPEHKLVVIALELQQTVFKLRCTRVPGKPQSKKQNPWLREDTDLDSNWT